MSRSKQDILDTEAMLARLAELLMNSYGPHISSCSMCEARDDAESLRRISMTLHAWHELECNGNIQREETWTIERCAHPAADRWRWWNGTQWARRAEPYWHSSQDGIRRWPVADRESGARKRLAKIMARYPSLQAYVQTDPRGCALYILKPGDVPEGADVSAYYSRGLAVYR